jgi:phosphoglycerate dehydrogenase-like enzyme
MKKDLHMFMRFLTLTLEQTTILKDLGVTITKTLDPQVNAIFSDQFFLESNLDKLPPLNYVQVATSGVDQIDLTHPVFKEAVVSGSRGVFNRPMTEYVISHLLSIYQNHRFFNQTKADKQWRPSRHGEELGQKKVAIIGLGQIGMQLAKVLSTFGCHVDGFNRRKKESPYLQQVNTLEYLATKIGDYEVVIVAIALNAQTKGIINKNVMESLHEKAIFVNVSRAEIIDETALVVQLQNKKIRHAILDTFSVEPLAKEHPLWELDNVSMTPHISFTSPVNLNRMFEALVTNLQLYRDESRLINQVK